MPFGGGESGRFPERNVVTISYNAPKMPHNVWYIYDIKGCGVFIMYEIS